jgi:hypothetical protein
MDEQIKYKTFNPQHDRLHYEPARANILQAVKDETGKDPDESCLWSAVAFGTDAKKMIGVVMYHKENVWHRVSFEPSDEEIKAAEEYDGLYVKEGKLPERVLEKTKNIALNR